MALTTTPSELTATALTLTTVAQPNITSVGTLTSLQVDNLNLNGNTISSTDTNGNITIAPNGTGDIYANTDKMIVLAAEGESATLMIVSDESDDNGDDWSFVANQSNNTLTIENDISGSSVAHMTLTPHATVASSTVSMPGKVGIGIATPTHKFHIVDGNNYALFGDTQSNSTMSLRMGDSPAYPVEVQAYGNDLRINTASSANATPTVKMLVQYTGYVGIGETSPDNKLHITGANWNNAHIKIERTDVGGSNDAGLVFKSAAGAATDTGLGGIWFQNALDSNAYALIRARTDDSSGTSGRLEFMTGTSSVGNGTTPALIIDSSGHLLPGSDSAKNLGSTSKRWDNLYVNDMHFSNEGSDGNDVDGTTGDWTLQEGEEYLYVINNKSGKKFKFSLEEVE